MCSHLGNVGSISGEASVRLLGNVVKSSLTILDPWKRWGHSDHR